MTIDTIKDVLGRIISINKNLTEDSLRNLLVASGWDNNDIEEGLKVYSSYGAKVQSVMPEARSETAMPASSPAIEAAAPAPQVVYTPTPMAEQAPMQAEAPVINVQAQTNFIPTPPPFFAPKPVSIPVTIPLSTPTLQTSAPIAMTPSPVVQTLPIVTTEQPKTFSTIALAVDIVLFILTLLLLVYVISQ